MSNLGSYQWMTTTAKKFGGPGTLFLLVGAAGAALYKGGELLARKGVLAFKAYAANYNSCINDVSHPMQRSITMGKYKIIFDGEEQDEIFDTEEEAKDYALYLCSCARTGAETLHWSNPGDYDYDENDFETPEYEIVEID